MHRTAAPLVLLAGLALAAAPAAAQNGRPTAFPVNEAHKIPALEETIEAILQAVDDRDTEALLQYVLPELQFSFGVENGAEAWAEVLNAPADSDMSAWREEIWFALADTMRLGGAFNERMEYCVPYFNCSFDPEDAGPGANAFTTIFVIRHDAAIRAQPRADAQVIGRSAYEVWTDVEFTDPPPDGDWEDVWARVVLPTGTPGYIWREDFRQWVGYRGYFVETPEGWRLQVFIAGD